MAPVDLLTEVERRSLVRVRLVGVWVAVSAAVVGEVRREKRGRKWMSVLL